MIGINPFIICDVAEQVRFRQMAEYEHWRYQCMALGADRGVLSRYDALASAYAATTLYPNSDVVAYCRQVALDTLLRGEPMPENPEAAIAAENSRRAIRAVESLRERFARASRAGE